MRKKKQKYLNRQREEPKEATDKGEIGVIFNITRNITYKNNSSAAVIKDKNDQKLAKTSTDVPI